MKTSELIKATLELIESYEKEHGCRIEGLKYLPPKIKNNGLSGSRFKTLPEIEIKITGI
jgi:hypothetical protein